MQKATLKEVAFYCKYLVVNLLLILNSNYRCTYDFLFSCARISLLSTV